LTRGACAQSFARLSTSALSASFLLKNKGRRHLFFHSHSCSLSLACALSFSHSFAYSHTHTHTSSLSFSLSRPPSCRLLRSCIPFLSLSPSFPRISILISCHKTPTTSEIWITSVFPARASVYSRLPLKTRVPRNARSDTKNQLPRSSYASRDSTRIFFRSEAPRLSRRTNEHSLFLTRRPEYLHFLARIPAVSLSRDVEYVHNGLYRRDSPLSLRY